MKKIILDFLFIVLLLLPFGMELSSAKGSWTKNGQLLEQTEKLKDILLIKFSGDGEYFYTFSSDSMFRKWNTESGQIVEETVITKFHEHETAIVDISKDGKYLLISSCKKIETYNDEIKVMKYDIAKDSVILTIYPPFKSVMQKLYDSGPPVYVFGSGCYAKFSNDEKTVFTMVGLSLEYSIYTGIGILNSWNSGNGNLLKSYCSGGVNNFVISDNDSNIAWNSTVSYDYNLKKKSIYCTYLNNIMLDSLNMNWSHTFTHDSRKYLSILNSDSRIIKEMNPENYKITGAIEIENFNKISNIQVSRNDKYILIDNPNYLNFINILSGNQIDTIPLPSEALQRTYQLHPQNNDLLCSTYNGIIRLIKADVLSKTLQADFTAKNRIEEKGKPVKFTDYSFDNPTKWNWDFGDGQTSVQQSPEHIYTDTGSYAITLIVSNGTISDTLIRKNYITIKEKILSIFENMTNSNLITLSPNPAKDYIEISVPRWRGIKGVDCGIKIYNVFGEEVYPTPALPEGRELGSPPLGKDLGGVLRLDVSSLPVGVYFVRVGEKMQKFIKT